jgi:hypothetical protein
MNNRHLPLALALGALALNSSVIHPAMADSWVTNSPMITARELHTATLLPNGEVLAVRGETGSQEYLSSAELYDAVAVTWVATGLLTDARAYHTATLLPSG